MDTHHLTRQQTRQTGAVQDEYQRRLEHEVEDREHQVMRRDVWRFLSETKVKGSEQKVPDSMDGHGANPSHLASSQFDTLRGKMTSRVDIYHRATSTRARCHLYLSSLIEFHCPCDCGDQALDQPTLLKMDIGYSSNTWSARRLGTGSGNVTNLVYGSIMNRELFTQ